MSIKTIIIISLLIIAIGTGWFILKTGANMTIHSNGNQQSDFLSTAAAKRYALQGFNQRRWAFPKKLSRAMSGAKAGEPLLVKRSNRQDSFYYIVPFSRNHLTTVLVNINARTGAFEETSYLRKPAVYPPIDQSHAKTLLIEHLKKYNPEITLEKTPTPNLVWEPCEQTQSPFEPLWRFHINSQEWFVSQTGNVFDQIEPIKIKGGGA